MKPYKGIIRISCKETKECVKVKLRENVQPACLNCPQAKAEILDLDEKVLFKGKAEGKREKKRGK